MNNEEGYLELLSEIMNNGYETTDRTGTGTKSVFGRQIRYDLSKNKIPLFTTKKVMWKGVVIELLWFLRGETNISYLKKYGVNIWDEWADNDGELGPVYGKQWRSWPKMNGSIDQIKNIIERIKSKPDCRRLIVSAWNPSEIEEMALPPCHTMFQFKVYGNKLNCQLYQRSADMFLGVPFNVASYSLLTHLIALECGLEAGEFIHTIGDAHVYLNHFDQVKEQIKRNPYELPKIEIKDIHGLIEFSENSHFLSWKEISEKIKLVDYNSHPSIKGKVAI